MINTRPLTPRYDVSVYCGTIKLDGAKIHNFFVDFYALGYSNKSFQGFCLIWDFLKFVNNIYDY